MLQLYKFRYSPLPIIRLWRPIVDILSHFFEISVEKLNPKIEKTKNSASVLFFSHLPYLFGRGRLGPKVQYPESWRQDFVCENIQKSSGLRAQKTNRNKNLFSFSCNIKMLLIFLPPFNYNPDLRKTTEAFTCTWPVNYFWKEQ